jgi:hypothetical protein
MAVIVALGRDHRIEAGGLLVAVYLAANLYAGACIARLAGFWPAAGLAALAWTHRRPVIVLTLLVAAVALAVDTAGLVRALAVVAVVAATGTQLACAYRTMRQQSPTPAEDPHAERSGAALTAAKTTDTGGRA